MIYCVFRINNKNMAIMQTAKAVPATLNNEISNNPNPGECSARRTHQGRVTGL